VITFVVPFYAAATRTFSAPPSPSTSSSLFLSEGLRALDVNSQSILVVNGKSSAIEHRSGVCVAWYYKPHRRNHAPAGRRHFLGRRLVGGDDGFACA